MSLFLTLLESNPRLLVDVRHNLTPVAQRLADLLTQLVPTPFFYPDAEVSMPLYTRTELAECLSVRLETISRIMAQWTREGRVRRDGNMMWWRP